jgi:hypothetical protein
MRPNITQKDYCQESGSSPPDKNQFRVHRAISGSGPAELSRVNDSHILIRLSAQ